MANYIYATSATSYTISTNGVGTSGSVLTSSGINGTSWTTGLAPNIMSVKCDAEFDGDIKIRGRSLEKLLERIEDRLAILQDPNPAKLEKYAALKKAYDHYKILEKLIGEE